MSLGYQVISQDDGAEGGEQATYECAIVLLIKAPDETGGDTGVYSWIIDSWFRLFVQNITLMYQW